MPWKGEGSPTEADPKQPSAEHAGAGQTWPRGELSMRTFAIPADTNQNGDIFGGWVLGQMDVAGGIFASKIVKGRCVTLAVDAMTFRMPVYVGDVVSVYTA